MNINSTKYTLLLLALFLFCHCTPISEALKTEEVGSIEIEVKITSESDLSTLKNFQDLEIKLTNVEENVAYVRATEGISTMLSDILPGIYTINITGKAIDDKGEEQFFNGSVQNLPLLKDGATVDIELFPGWVSPIVFKEIFYSGTQQFYFRNQFYEIYNNSDELFYLDGLYFCVAEPMKATTKKPIWPAEDGNKYIYTDRLWKIPGGGKEYPLYPGESAVLSQFAANHQLEIYNPDSPIDGSTSEFEFNMNNAKFPDQPAYDMVHVFHNGYAEMGRTPQYLTSVFGCACIIFRVPEGEVYDPVADTSLQAKDASSKQAKVYAKVPVRYVLDAVEAADNENALNMKRLPSMLDIGMTWVGGTYNSLGIVRKKIGERADGTPILQDTNNSTNDFEHGVVPVLRRYNSKMPAWNHTLKN